MFRYLISALACLGSLHAFPEIESFESGVPEYMEAEGGKLTTTGEHIQDGKQALRWEFKDGDSFVIKTGPLGNVNVWTGYGNYARSSLTFPLYLESLGKGHLLIEVRAGDETVATIEVPLAHVGWQQLVYHYSWKSKMKYVNGGLRSKIDNFRIVAHGTEGTQQVWFDKIIYNKPRDFRDERSAITELWAPEKHDFSDLADPEPEELAKIEKLYKLLTPQPNPNIGLQHWEKRIAHHRKQIQVKNMRMGFPIKKAAHYYYRDLSAIANDWNRCADPDARKQLAECFNTINDWLQEQGLVVNGASGKQNNYIGRTYVDAVTKMREPLAENGSLEATINFIKWSYDYDERVFGEKSRGMSMDYFHNEALRTLRIALTHGDPVTRYHHVNQFRHRLSEQLTRSIKPDGSIFHHGFHYFAYGTMGMNSVSGTVAAMTQAGLPVSKEALDSIRLAVDSMMWYCGRGTLFSLSGRNASGKQGINPGTIKNLAKAYAPYNQGQADKALIADYLRYAPNQIEKVKSEFGFTEIQPAPPRMGHRFMPYAAMSLHRRDHWLAGVKGYSKYAAGGESYDDANRFGFWMSMGHLELLTHPKPLPTVHGSGTRPDEGFNWSAIEGATTIHTPLKNIANGNGTRITRSAEKFVGGLTNGDNGLFALTFNNGITNQIMRQREEGAPNPEPLKALKTWFCFDDRVVCLGSNISTKNVTYPVRTNLFQKFLTDTFTTTAINGEALTLKESTTTRYSDGATELIDPYGNAYFTKGGNPVRLEIGQQESRNNNDKKDTTGNYATAWIEHGIDPQDGSYEYAVLVQPSQDEIEAFDPESAYTVFQQDAKAHIVHDHATDTTGYVVFDAEAELPADSALASAAQPCLVMVANHDDHLLVSITNPDVRPKETEAQTVSIQLRGDLTAAEDTADSTVVESSTDLTTVSVPVMHGESINVRLDKPAPPVKEESADSSQAPVLSPGVIAIIAGLIVLFLIVAAKRK